MLRVGQSWAHCDQNIISDHDEPKIAPNRARGGSCGLMEVADTSAMSCGTHLTVLTLVLRCSIGCHTPIDEACTELSGSIGRA